MTTLNNALAARSNLYNLSASRLPALRAAVAKVRAGTGNCRILCCGDSTTRGLQATGDATQYQKGYPPKMSAQLSRLGLSSTWQGFFGSSRSASYASLDNRTAVSGGFASVLDSATIGGGYFQSTATGTFSFTPTQNCDTFRIWYLTYQTGSFSINLDGGSTLATPSISVTSSISSTTVTGSLGAHTLNMVWVSGTVKILGIEAYDSTTKQVCVINAGSSGTTSTMWNNSSPFQTKGALALILPDLVIFDISINDSGSSIVPATTLSNVNAFVAAAKATGADVILKAPVPSAISSRTLALQQTYIDALYSAALTNDVPLIDNYKRFGTQEAMNTLGLYSDTQHPNETGYTDVGTSVVEALGTVI